MSVVVFALFDKCRIALSTGNEAHFRKNPSKIHEMKIKNNQMNCKYQR